MNKTLAGIWLLCIVVAVYCYFFLLGNDGSFLSSQIRQLVGDSLLLSGLIYVLLLSIRGMTFIPSTPLLFAGLAIFPPHFTFAANMIGIFTSSCLVMLSIRRVGIEAELAKIKNRRYLVLSDKIQKHGYYAIVFWSFFPFAPTDAIVYIASGIGVSRKKIIAGVMTGETILMIIYVYGGNALLGFLSA